MSSVAIIDYGLCNLDSVARSIEKCGSTPVITDNRKDLDVATHIILPGVGSFPKAINNIRERSIDRYLEEQIIDNRVPFLGICLGMQLLADTGFENHKTEGLGFISGEVIPLTPSGEDTRIPHVGWNEVLQVSDHPLFKGIEVGRDFYFLHSYHFCPSCKDDILAYTPYAGQFVSAVTKDNIHGVQFHPEKSQKAGFAMFKNFLSFR